MGNSWNKHELLDIHSAISTSKKHENDPVNNDELVKYMNLTNDSILIVTKNNKPICYTLSYDNAITNINNIKIQDESVLIDTIGEFKIYNVKGIGY